MRKTIVDENGKIVKYEIKGTIKNEKLLSKDDLIKILYEAASIVDFQKEKNLRENTCPEIGVEYSVAALWIDEVHYEDLSDIPNDIIDDVYIGYKNYQKTIDGIIYKILQPLTEVNVESDDIYLSIYLDDRDGQQRHYYDIYWQKYFESSDGDYKENEILKQWERSIRTEYNGISYRVVID